MSFLLYQLHSTRELQAGADVIVNGPYDTYGKIISSKKVSDNGKQWLNLIRGCGTKKPTHDYRISYEF